MTQFLRLKMLEEKIDFFENSRNYIVHAIAGIGKTHFSVSLFNSLKSKGLLPIFLKGYSFSGSDYSIGNVLKKILDLPSNLTFDVFLRKLNSFAEKKGKKIIFIIDGINETTHPGGGFSPIWQNDLETLHEKTWIHKNIFSVITCRTSYLGKIDKNLSNSQLLELRGFNNKAHRVEALGKYFEEYHINVPNLESLDLGFFQVPLLLNIFCRNTNPTKTGSVAVNLDNQTYEGVLGKFIVNEANLLAEGLDRPTGTPIQNAIQRSSIKFRNTLSAVLTLDDFLESTDGTEIDNIFKSSSIGFHLLQRELLYIKEMIPSVNEEMVVHTFQNIGGFLIAQTLIDEFNNAKDLVSSKFYEDHLKGSISGKEGGPLHDEIHQLATDILKFLVIAFSKKNDELIGYTKDKLVQEYTWKFLFENPQFEERVKLIEKLELLVIDQDGWGRFT